MFARLIEARDEQWHLTLESGSLEKTWDVKLHKHQLNAVEVLQHQVFASGGCHRCSSFGDGSKPKSTGSKVLKLHIMSSLRAPSIECFAK